MVSILTHAVFITKESMMDFLLFKGIKMPFHHLLIQPKDLNIFSSTLKKRNDHKNDLQPGNILSSISTSFI